MVTCPIQHLLPASFSLRQLFLVCVASPTSAAAEAAHTISGPRTHLHGRCLSFKMSLTYPGRSFQRMFAVRKAHQRRSRKLAANPLFNRVLTLSKAGCECDVQQSRMSHVVNSRTATSASTPFGCHGRTEAIAKWSAVGGVADDRIAPEVRWVL